MLVVDGAEWSPGSRELNHKGEGDRTRQGCSGGVEATISTRDSAALKDDLVWIREEALSPFGSLRNYLACAAERRRTRGTKC